MIIKRIVHKIKNLPNRCFERDENELCVLFKRFSTEPIRVVPSRETLKEAERYISSQIPGAFLRFGDGDICLLNGLNDLLQKPSPELQKEMKEAFHQSGVGIMKSAPLNCEMLGYEKGMEFGKHKRENAVCLEFLRSTFPFFIGHRIHGTGALHYCAEFETDCCIDFLKFLKGNNPILVGNEDIPTDISRNFIGAKKHIPTPCTNAYSCIDDIEKRILSELSTEMFQLVIVAMGCSGRVLSKRILKHQKRVFLFDFGSLLDAISGWDSRTWIKKMDSKSLMRIRESLLTG